MYWLVDFFLIYKKKWVKFVFEKKIINNIFNIKLVSKVI